MKLIENFCLSLKHRYTINFKPERIYHELLKAPIQLNQLNLQTGKGAVYVFSLNKKSQAPAGPNRVLKVGKVGPNSLNRFRYQHYNPGSANSTLSGSISMLEILWDYIGIGENVSKEIDFGQWLIENTDRDHFHMEDITIKTNSQKIILIDSFEYYLRGILGPVFEG